MRIEILAVDRVREPWARRGVDFYLERIGHYGPVEHRNIKASKLQKPQGAREEARRLLDAAAPGPRDRIVALSPAGKTGTSESWAAMLDRYRTEGIGRVVFVVGGADGLDDTLIQAAAEVISLGPQTLPHELAQLVLAEQIYRAWTILRNEPYHR